MSEPITLRTISLDSKVSEEFFSIYKNHFLPAYADLVALTIDKPSIILLEEEAAFTHLMRCAMDEDAEMNLRKAKGHIYRASVDCYKLMWERVYETVTDINEYRAAYEDSEVDLLNKLRELYATITDSRLAESMGIGKESEEVLDLWKNALKLGLDIYYSTNAAKLRKLKKRAKYSAPFYSGPFPTYVYPAIVGAIFLIVGFFLGRIL